MARQFAAEELPVMLALRGASSFNRGHFAAAAEVWSAVDSDAARFLARWAEAEATDVDADLAPACSAPEAESVPENPVSAPAAWGERVHFERDILVALTRVEHALDRGEEVDEAAL